MEKLNELRRILKNSKIDALLVTQPENRRYLSRYSATDSSISETSGVLLILRRGTPLLLTDSRFELHAASEARGFEIMLYPRGLLPLLQKLLPKMGVRRLGFESHYLLHATAGKLTALTGRLGIEAVPLVGLVEKMRVRKEQEEIDRIEKSVLLNEQVFQKVFATLRAGQPEREVAMRIENTMLGMGAERPSFATIVAGGPNAASPHAVPGSRPFKQGETIVIDMGLILDGYCSDMTRTVVLGTPDQKTVELFRLVRKAQLAATAAIRAGITGREADRAARQVITAAGLGDRFGHGLGHGVGLAVHEAPSLNRRNGKKLQSGMIITVEPGVYLPGWGGIRLENMGVVEEKGCRILNRDTTFLDL
ncbi:MAG: aminopeptidase P family protein [Desulfobulbaceae bacterium]|nr:aminopeptidase P family protein [Desulfobulbaceae bacterium]